MPVLEWAIVGITFVIAVLVDRYARKKVQSIMNHNKSGERK